MSKTGVGIVGCGNISEIYFKNLCTVFENVEVRCCADLDMERAKAKANAFEGVEAVTKEELLGRDDVEIVVNLTTPQSHFSVDMEALAAGKHVHGEKPLVLARDEGRALLQAGADKGLRVGAAPDTFLGGGIQTCRKLIDEGVIGEPVGAQAFMFSRGHESWHPDPEFYYKAGGGPMFDMGPYYLTALVALLGPVATVTGTTRISFPERTITSEKKYGQKIPVDVPTHIAGIMNFESGPVGTITTSFDVWGSQVPQIEIFGSEGTLSVPNPNSFGGPVFLRRSGKGKDWEEIPLTHGYIGNSRGIAVADMADAIQTHRPHRASGALAYHVLDLMHAFHDASEQGRHVAIESRCERPAAMEISQ